MSRKRIVQATVVAAVVALLVTVLVLTWSGGGNDSQRSNPAPTPSPTEASADPLEASRQAAWEAELAATRRVAEQRAARIEARVTEETSQDRRLSIIVTAYCQLPHPSDRVMVDSDTGRLLEKLYEKYWQAGGKWNRPLDSAARQTGACPDMFRTPRPPLRG